MPQTIAKTSQGAQIIGGIFKDRANADRAVDALQELGISPIDIQMIVQLSARAVKDIYKDLLSERGVSETQAKYYDRLIRQGRVMVAVYDVVDPAPVIDILDEFQAEFNPDGSRNLRDDVLGMTTGAVMGAAAFGALGGVVAGPAGAAVGAAAGGVLGGGSGASVGEAAEHKK
jgi:hypothetical protein